MITDRTLENAEVVEAPKRRRRAKKVPATSQLGLLLTNPLVKAGLVVLGVLAAVGVAAAIAGPKRIEEDVYEPIRDAIEPHAEKLRNEANALRGQIAELLDKAAPESRRRLARNLQSWIGHFRAD